MQKGTYVHGKREKPDEPRKVYKLYNALMLTDIVAEMPLPDVTEKFFRCHPGLDKLEHFRRHKQEIKILQARPSGSLPLCLTACSGLPGLACEDSPPLFLHCACGWHPC